MGTADFQPGDWVIFRKQKASSAPGPRAREVDAAARGELYDYLVDKFWVVQEVMSEGKLRVRTRRGKQHLVGADDTRLRKANWWERWWYGKRFRAVEQSQGEGP